MTLDRSVTRLMLSSALALVLATPALAQTTTPPTAEEQPPAATQDMQAPDSGTTGSGMESPAADSTDSMNTDEPAGSTATDSTDGIEPPTGSTATDDLTAPTDDSAAATLPTTPTEPILVAQEPGQLLSDEVIGLDVRNMDDESIGSISKLLFDENDQVIAALVSVGGFLGIGAKDVAVNWSEFRFEPEENRAVVMLSREQLEEAPAFEDRHQQQAAAEQAQREAEQQQQRVNPATPPAAD